MKKTPDKVPDFRHAIDPRLMYAMILPTEGSGHQSLFQDFSTTLLSMRWVFERLVLLPATIYEPHAPLPDLLAMRIAGLASWRLRQLPAQALDRLSIGERMPLWVLFTADGEAAKAASAFARRQRFTPLHFSITGQSDTVPFEEMTLERLQAHILTMIDTAQTPSLVEARPIRGLAAARKARRKISSQGPFRDDPQSDGASRARG